MSSNATAQRPKPAASPVPVANEKLTRLYAIVISILLLLGVIFVFAQVRTFEFLGIDDGEYVTENAAIKSGLSWSTVKWCFTHTVAANWHPLAMMSHALDCTLFGQNAGAHHLVNVAFHAANTVLLFWLLLSLLRPTDDARSASATHLWMCAIVAALFGLHPLRAESVAWISERKDVLSAFFFILTLISYVRYVRLRQQKLPAVPAYITTLVLYSLGLLAKPMLVTMPFVLLLIDYWPLGRVLKINSLRSVIAEKIPMFLLCGAVSAATFISQNRAGSVVTLDRFSVSDRLINAVVSYARYLSKTFIPINLCGYYPYETWSLWQILGSILLVLIVTAFAVRSARKRPYLFVGCFWFVGMLVPVIGFAQVGGQSMADRYTYLPHIGLFIAVTWGLFEVARKPALIALSVAAIASAVLAAQQTTTWHDSVVLFERILRLTKNNVSGEYFMALAYESKHRDAEAVPHFVEAIRGNDSNIKAMVHLGRIYSKLGKYDDARKQFETALSIDSNLPLTQMDLGDALMHLNRRDEAIEHFIAAMSLNPDIPEAHFELSNLLASKHDYAGAISHLRTAVQLKPDWPVTLNSLAWMLATQPDAKLRDGRDAVRLAEQAVALSKNDPGFMDTLAAAYAEAGRFPDAIKTAENAIQLATASNQPGLAAEIKSRLQLYQASTAYRE